VALVVGAAVLAAESAHAGWLVPVAAGGALFAAVLAVCGPALWAVVNQALRRA
jgi:hypothetical protein